MSDFTDILTGRLKVQRFTANVVDKKVIVSPLPVDRQPARSCRLAIEVSGASVASGQVYLAGTTTETVSFSDNGVEVNTKDFTAVSGITIAGLSGGYIEVKAVSKTGQPINQEKLIHSSIAVRFYPLDRFKVKMLPAGQQKMATHKFMAEYDKDIQENDVIYAISGIAGLTRGQVTFVQQIADFDGITHHLECEVMQL